MSCDPIQKLRDKAEAKRIQSDPRYQLLDPLINFAHDAAEFATRKHCIQLFGTQWKQEWSSRAQ